MMEFSILLADAQRGDAGALAELHRRYEPIVLARVRERLGATLRRHYDTRDLGQSVVVEVLRDLPRFEDRGELAFRHWLYIKAENKVRAKFRKHLNGANGQREVALSTSDGHATAVAGPGPATAAGDADTRQRLNDIVAALEEGSRAVVMLRGYEGLPFAAIAERLGLPGAEAARKRYVRALLSMREQWTTG